MSTTFLIGLRMRALYPLNHNIIVKEIPDILEHGILGFFFAFTLFCYKVKIYYTWIINKNRTIATSKHMNYIYVEIIGIRNVPISTFCCKTMIYSKDGFKIWFCITFSTKSASICSIEEEPFFWNIGSFSLLLSFIFALMY